MRKSLLIPVFTICFQASFMAQAQPIPTPLFAGQDVLKITIKVPMSKLKSAQKKAKRPLDKILLQEDSLRKLSALKKEVQIIKDKSLVSGSLTYQDNSIDKVLPIAIQLRGNFRLASCSLAPFKMIFGDESDNTLFEGNKRLKIVNRCKTSSSYDNYLMNEFMAYRILNQISDRSFMVRLAEITYVDSQKPNEIIKSSPAFIIETKSSLRKRFDLKSHRVRTIRKADLDSKQTAVNSLFQYLIGNTDWSTVSNAIGEPECCHNYKLLTEDPDTITDPIIYPVPYDFDHSGLVNASYAFPNDRLGASKITDRIFRGFCINKDLYSNIIADFRTKKTQIISLFNHPLITSSSKKKSLKYIEGFYKKVSTVKSIEKNIIKKCR